MSYYNYFHYNVIRMFAGTHTHHTVQKKSRFRSQHNTTQTKEKESIVNGVKLIYLVFFSTFVISLFRLLPISLNNFIYLFLYVVATFRRSLLFWLCCVWFINSIYSRIDSIRLTSSTTTTTTATTDPYSKLNVSFIHEFIRIDWFSFTQWKRNCCAFFVSSDTSIDRCSSPPLPIRYSNARF